ncbi:SGNH/GDSL hydrolase family protein [Draconibacterium sp. IB214405]|uniref:SGNH/GDSL hydrolase family protein n=1 Tax=Draconibacterium sp. IB214405 TaxID=3097352 RepID=UPI002A16203C|nr:SGNH/GDSL hydrolase family protein [Draconibacterium sp. IB214405]MDX8339640.1 SGNH/GDSL hydrolase family protein [Draconibacterium sp. IB214405]
MKNFFYAAFAIIITIVNTNAQTTNNKVNTSQWEGKKVAFLGDSMTEKWDPENKMYWEYLTDWLQIEPFVYGVNGDQWSGIYNQAKKLRAERGVDIDAIIIFAGTNDYNANLPLGKFFDEKLAETNHNGKIVLRKYRTLIENDTTFCGRINKVISYLKTNFPDQQIIIMTPIHRGYAKFGDKNIQPEESFANDLGFFINGYVNTLKEASSLWSVPIFDLFADSGLYPMKESQIKYFKNEKTDMLHIGSLGNFRLAKTIQFQLLSLPSTFVIDK